jgi:hypothetical protein
MVRADIPPTLPFVHRETVKVLKASSDFPGCFRCHDDNHTAKDGKKISQDCDSCHTIE